MRLTGLFGKNLSEISKILALNALFPIKSLNSYADSTGEQAIQPGNILYGGHELMLRRFY